ncbi:glycosyltransferase [Candidatus Daviesbacteria bacterium]|nr:glycosyltransferase [Candidatus Daviesbacteria bacterium]
MSAKLTAKERTKVIKRALKGENISGLCREYKISRTLLYRWINRCKLAQKKREERQLRPQDRQEMIERVKLGENVAKVCSLYNVSRTAFYKWLERYEQAPEGHKLEALWDKQPKVERYFNQASEEYEEAVLSAVREYPELSSHKLVWALPQVGGKPILSNHGVQNVLKRHSLNTYGLRLAYSKAYYKPTALSRFFAFIQSVLAAVTAQPAQRRNVLVRGSFVFALTIFSLVTVYGLFSLSRLVLGAGGVALSLGLILSLIALGFGMFFFLYSLKYYITIAMVLSFSRRSDEENLKSQNSNLKSASQILNPNHQRKSFLQNIQGTGRDDVIKYQGGLGLKADLSGVILDRQPFVSIHLATYNEKRVLERLLTAATAQEYENYEVVIVDDSTEQESIDILNKWKKHPRVKVIHRESREGYKGGALREALKISSPRTEFVLVFDADFIPYPDTITSFLKYFKLTVGNLETKHSTSNVAAVQGYQWHVLNKSENWITRGVKSEYSGSYVIERSGEELYSGLKQIAGSVYMIRADVLKELGWGTSITEDFQLTLRLYERGYKVVFTPYIQAPAEAVSTIKRLIRQRMRWAEGHSHNIKKMLIPLLTSKNLTWAEKFEVLYLTPYYLQAAFFIFGTLCWFLAEVVFRVTLPFWTSTWGWSLVLTNLFALPLMNLVGLFLEESNEKDYLGLPAFMALSYVVAPFQGYAAIKGFLEKEEGPWFRTPKTGRITDVFTPGKLYKFVFGWLGKTVKHSANPAIGQINRMYSQEQLAEFAAMSEDNVTLSETKGINISFANAQDDRGRIYQTQPNVVVLAISKAVSKLTVNQFSIFIFQFLMNFQWFKRLNSKLKKIAASLALLAPRNDGGRSPHLAVSSSFNTFNYFKSLNSLNHPVPAPNRLVGKIILASFVIVFILLNQAALFNQYTVDLRHMSIKAKEGGPISRKLAAGAPLPIDPTIEQQINITTQEYSTQSITDMPTDNSLGLVRYTAASYTSPTTYFEAVIKNSNSSTTTASLYDSTGAYVAGSAVTATGATYTRVRSAAITLTTGTDYTVRLRSSPGNGAISSGTASIIAARIIVVQATDSNITNTETQVEVGDNETTSKVDLTPLSNPKYFKFDPTKYDAGSITAYFEATLKASNNTPAATSTGPNSPSSCADDGAVGTLTWTNDSNATAQDDQTAVMQGTDNGTSEYEECVGFSFNLAPTDTVAGVLLEADIYSSGTSTRPIIDNSVKLSQAGTITGNDQATTDAWPTSDTDTYTSWGSSSNLWGVSWTPADINDPNFGAGISARKTTTAGNPGTGKIDHVRMTVYYTPAAAAQTATAELYNRTDGLAVTESSVSTSNLTWTRARSSALSTNWDTTNADEYEVRVKTSDTTANASIANAKVVLVQNVAGGIGNVELYHNYINAPESQNSASVGTFSTTNQGQIPLVRMQGSSVINTIGSSTYVYVLGGCNAACSSTTDTSTVYKSTINNVTGDAGVFSTTSQGQLVTENSDNAVVTSSLGGTTYIYEIGGDNGARKSTVYKASINSSGDIGTFATTSQGQMPAILGSISSNSITVGPSSYIYILGGAPATGQSSTVYKSTLNSSNGDAGAFATTSQQQLPIKVRDHTSVSTTVGPSTYIYVVGGESAAFSSAVYKSTIDSSGDVSAVFATTSQGQLPQISSQHYAVLTAVGQSTYLYTMGGSPDGGTTVVSTVYKSTLDSATGDLSTFSTTNQQQLVPLTFGLSANAALVGPSTYLYVLGGYNGSSALSTVYKAPLSNDFDSFGYNNLYNSNDWIGGTFTFYQESTLKQTQAGVTANSRLTPGGIGNVSSTLMPNAANGNFGVFATTSQGQVPEINSNLSSSTAMVNGSTYIYVLGGNNDSANQSTVYKSTVNSTTGDAGAFATTSQGQLPQILEGLQTRSLAVGSSTYIYTLGGYTGTAYKSTVYKSTLKAASDSTNGDAGAFATTSQAQLPLTNGNFGSTILTSGASTYIYVIGGASTASVSYSTNYKALIDPTTGDIGAFATTSQAQLPAAGQRLGVTSAVIGPSSYLYVGGGCSGCGTPVSTFYKATIDPTTGDIGTLATTNQAQLPTALRQFNITSTIVGPSTYLYVFGGCTGGVSCGNQSTVYKSTLNSSNGDAGTFATTSQGQLAQPLIWVGGSGAIASAGPSTYLYVLGGLNTSSVSISTVYKSALQQNPYERQRSGDITSYLNGSLAANAGTFDTTNQAQLPKMFRQHSAVSTQIGNSTYVYVLGAFTDLSSVLSTAYKSTLDNNTGNLSLFNTSNQAQLLQAFRLAATTSLSVGVSTYVYVLGGFTSSANISTVYKSTINSATGDLGTFDTTSQGQVPQALRSHTINSAQIGVSTYIYVLGGVNTGGSDISTIYTSTVNSATGDLGTFDTTSQAQLPRVGSSFASITQSVGPSTYLYVIGIQGNTSVYRSVINSTSGYLGVFDTTSQGQLVQNTTQHSAIATVLGPSTYIYVLGGSSMSTIYRAALNSSTGNINTFTTTSQSQLLNISRENTAIIANTGPSTYIFQLGGFDNGSSTTFSTVYKSVLTEDLTPGNLNVIQTTYQGQLPAALSSHATVVGRDQGVNYIYQLGDNPASTVYKSAIDANGYAGTFATTNQAQLTQTLKNLQAVSASYGGTTYIYTIGGDNGSAITSTVYRANSNGTSGNLTVAFATTSQAQLPQGLQNHQAVIGATSGDNYIYALGGCNLTGFCAASSTQSTVYKANIKVSADAQTFATTSQKQLLKISEAPASVTATMGSSTYVYVLGGYDQGGVINSTVYKTTLNSTTGDAGAFATTSQGQLVVGLQYQSALVSTIGSSTYLYVLGGYNGSDLSTVYKTTLNSTTGDIGAFATTNQGQLVQINESHASVTTAVGPSTYVYVLGGTSDGGTTIFSTVYKSTINSTTGDIGAFATTSQQQLPALREKLASFVAAMGPSTYVYVLGGAEASVKSTNYKATLNASGDIGAFATTSQGQLPNIIYMHSAITSTIGSSTYVYVLGGNTGSGVISTVYKSTLNSTTGDLGAFATTNQAQLSQPFWRHSSVISVLGPSTYFYILGGCDNNSCTASTVRSTVYKSALNTDPIVQTFATTSQSQLPQVVKNFSANFTTILGTNYIYAIGGDSGASSGTGDAGTFDTTSQGQLPLDVNAYRPFSVNIGASTYVYVVGGFSGSLNNKLSTNYKATLNNTTGDAGTFATTSQAQLPTALRNHALISTTVGISTYVYTIGGENISTVYKSTIVGSGANAGDLGTFATTSQSQLPEARKQLPAALAAIGSSQYAYVVGGYNASGTNKSTVYKVSINSSSGDLGTFDTTSQSQLPQVLAAHSLIVQTIGSSTYLYAVGGENGGTKYSTNYKATLNNTTGDVGTFDTTSQGQLPRSLTSSTAINVSVGSSSYIYVLGGDPGGLAVSTVYKTTINGTTGDAGTFATTSQAQLIRTNAQNTVLTSTVGPSSYLYFIGGCLSTNGCANSEVQSTVYRSILGSTKIAESTVYKSTVDSSANVGSFATTAQTQLSTALQSHGTAFFQNSSPYLYVIGGCVFGGTPCGIADTRQTIYRTSITSSTGDVGAFSYSANGLPIVLNKLTTTTATLGATTYLYISGGALGTTDQSTFYQSRISNSEFDTQIQNATVANSWLVVDVSSLQIPENLLGFLPLGLLLPKLMKKFRRQKD